MLVECFTCYHKFKMSYVKATQFIKFSFFIICVFLLLLCISKEFKRFISNEDFASISFRTFNFSPQDKYPAITFCISEGYDDCNVDNLYDLEGNQICKPIFDEKSLKNYNLSTSEYWKIINGKTNATSEDINNLPEFSNVTIHLEDMILGKTNPNEWDSVNINSETLNFSNKDFYLSHQDPNQICYSMASEFKPNQLKFTEYILMGVRKLSSGIYNLSNGVLRVYLHSTGQVVRNLGKEIFREQIRWMKAPPLGHGYGNGQIVTIHLSAFTVLRRRLDAKITCNPNVHEDDDMFRNYVIEKAECIPPYWKIFRQNSTDFKSCDSPKQLKEASSYNNYRKQYKVFDQLNPPCSEITTTSTVAKFHDSRGSSIRFFYRDDRYLEITNLPDFEFNSLWSSIGGFVGIFLGISVFQIAEIVLEIINKLVIAK